MIGKIQRLELRNIWRNEAHDFTTWMAANIDCLSEALGFELLFESREHSVGSFSIDILASDESGQKVIIENQLERTDHGHLGQIVTYCANLDAKTCIWISKEPRQEHINAVNWLNKETSLNFYLLKVEAISIDGSKPAPLFQIVCKPDEDIRSAAAHSSELTERGKFNIEYWAEINKKCEGKLPGFCSRKPLKYAFHSQASGRGGLSFAFIAGSRLYAVDLYIDTNDANVNEYILKQLEADRSKIEGDFGGKLEFDSLPEKRACRIRFKIGEGDVMKLDRNKIQAELIDHMVRLEKSLKPRIKNLSFEIEEAAS